MKTWKIGSIIWNGREVRSLANIFPWIETFHEQTFDLLKLYRVFNITLTVHPAATSLAAIKGYGDDLCLFVRWGSVYIFRGLIS